MADDYILAQIPRPAIMYFFPEYLSQSLSMLNPLAVGCKTPGDIALRDATGHINSHAHETEHRKQRLPTIVWVKNPDDAGRGRADKPDNLNVDKPAHVPLLAAQRFAEARRPERLITGSHVCRRRLQLIVGRAIAMTVDR
jgi:hypothetical protein